MAEIWHRGPLWVLESPEKKRNRLEKFLALLDHFLMTSLLSTNLSKPDFQKVLEEEFRLFYLKDYEK